MKYKVVGVLDILLSSLFLVSQLGIVFFVYPKMSQMYSEFNLDLPFITRYFYFFSILFIILYVCIFIVGIKLVKSPNQKLFVVGLFSLVVMLLFSGYFIATSILGAITPLYNLSSSL